MYRPLQNIRDIERYRIRARRRIIVDRMNPFEAMTKGEFLKRFRLSKECVNVLIRRIEHQLPIAQDERGTPVPPHLQVLIGLRYMATGGHQLTIADCYDVSQSFVSLCVKRIAVAVGCLCREEIRMPSDTNVLKVMEDFQGIAGMPEVVGAIDCTHIPIKRPSGDQPELYRNRKGTFSLNVQAVCGADLKFYNLVATWWGSEHKSNIFENSRICQEFDDGLHRGHLLGDCGYPCRRYLLTPVSNPQEPQERRYNESHIKTRNTIEHAFNILKRRFSCLGKSMQTKLTNTQCIIVAAAVLHNIAIAHNVPLPDDDPPPPEEPADVNDPPPPTEPADVDDSPPPEFIAGMAERRCIIRNYY